MKKKRVKEGHGEGGRKKKNREKERRAVEEHL